MPNLYATADDCNNVAAHVHAETIPAAINPGLTEREAELNSSADVTLYDVYRIWSLVKPIMLPLALLRSHSQSGEEQTQTNDYAIAGTLGEKVFRHVAVATPAGQLYPSQLSPHATRPQTHHSHWPLIAEPTQRLVEYLRVARDKAVMSLDNIRRLVGAAYRKLIWWRHGRPSR